jgi:serine/threonine protein phosphatase PrpC
MGSSTSSYLNEPILEKRTVDGEVKFDSFHVQYGGALMQGWRAKMEDYLLVFDTGFDDHGLILFALFDGHGMYYFGDGIVLSAS